VVLLQLVIGKPLVVQGSSSSSSAIPCWRQGSHPLLLLVTGLLTCCGAEQMTVVLLCWLCWQQHKEQQQVMGPFGLHRPHPMHCQQRSSSSGWVRTLALLQTWGWQQHETSCCSSSSSILAGQAAGVVLMVCSGL
jgi:hypothetical protein